MQAKEDIPVNIKKTLALILAFLMAATVFVSCAETGGETESTTEAATAAPVEDQTTESLYDKDGYLKDALPEKLDFNGIEIWTLYDSKVSNPEFFVEEENGEQVNDAIWKRNLTTEGRLNVSLKYNGVKGNDGNQVEYCTAAQTDYDSGDNLYAIYGSYSRTIPLLSMRGFLQDLYETEYLDFDKPWWPKSVTSELTIKGKLLMATGDISTNVLWMMSVFYYNRELWNDAVFGYNLEDVANSGGWTIDKLIEIVKDYYKDDGDGAVNANDTFGIVMYNACCDAFLNSCGVISIDKDGEGNLKLSDDFLGEKTDTIITKLATIAGTKTFHHSSTSADEKAIFFAGHSLFITDGTFIITNSSNGKDISFGYGILPTPKFDENQDRYITNIRYPYQIYAINSKSQYIKEASAVLEAQASHAYRIVTPAIFEVTMKTRYSLDNVSSKMYDYIRDGVVFDLGRMYNYSLDNYYPDFRNCIFNGGAGWIRKISGKQQTIAPQLEAIMELYSN